jgi:hypothetical protein
MMKYFKRAGLAVPVILAAVGLFPSASAALAQDSRSTPLPPPPGNNGRVVVDAKNMVVGYLLAGYSLEIIINNGYLSLLNSQNSLQGYTTITPGLNGLQANLYWTSSNCTGQAYIPWNGLLPGGYIVTPSGGVSTTGTLYYSGPAQTINVASYAAFGSCQSFPPYSMTAGVVKTSDVPTITPPLTVK